MISTLRLKRTRRKPPEVFRVAVRRIRVGAMCCIVLFVLSVLVEINVSKEEYNLWVVFLGVIIFFLVYGLPCLLLVRRERAIRDVGDALFDHSPKNGGANGT